MANVQSLCNFLKRYEFLSDTYVIEFFTESHWSKLPKLWQESLQDITLNEFCHQMYRIKCPLVLEQQLVTSTALPLSLLSFSATSSMLSHDRGDHLLYQTNLQLTDHLVRRHVKPKKQHELIQIGQCIIELCNRTGCNNVIDIGCGQGHMTRYLALHYGLNVVAIEGLGCHVETAVEFDIQVADDLKKKLKKENIQQRSKGSVHYIKQMVRPDVSSDELLHLLSSTGSGIHGNYILVGLHTCGDLSATMLRLFVESDIFVGLVSVGCCYMKLSDGYPLSQTVSSLPSHQLSYEAKELACHAKEKYIQRLIEGSVDHLKVHSYRAAVELILRKNSLKRSHLKVPKNKSKLCFKSYITAILQSVNISANQDDLDYIELMSTNHWQHIVIYFLLRITLAPCIETLILLDRQLFLQEKGFECSLNPIFNPFISPRNLVLTAAKT